MAKNWPMVGNWPMIHWPIFENNWPMMSSDVCTRWCLNSD